MNHLLHGRYQLIKVLESDDLEQTYLVGDTQLAGYPKCIIRHLQLPTSRTPRTLQFVLTLLKKKAETLQRFSKHDQLPTILEYFEESNNFYIVEEFVLGQPLSDAVVPGRPISETSVIRLLEEILEILVVVHGWGLVHRNIKPSNLIRRQSDKVLVLAGFGVFKAIGAQAVQSPQSSSVNGTNGNAYIPPDQLQGQLHFGSDLYAVGMISIQALTGLSTDDLMKLSYISPSGTRELSWHDHAQVSSLLMGILDRMIHPDGEQRYQQASAVLDDLSRAVAGKEALSKIVAIEPPLPTVQTVGEERLPQRSRKRFWMLMIGAGFLLATLLATLPFKLPQSLLAQYFLRQGNDQAKQHNNEAAIANYSRSIQLYPTGAAYYQRGIAYGHQQEQAALEDLTQAVELEPDMATAYYQRGNVWFNLGDNQRALSDYTQAIQLDPSIPEIYVNRGSVRADLGDEQGAIADYTQAIQLNPNLTAAYLNRCLSRSNLDDHQGAIADCTQAINLQPNSVLAYQNRGLVRRRLGDRTGAIEDFNIAIRLNPKDPDPYYNRGLARYELGDKQGAIADYSAAIQHDSNHVFAYYDRGLVRLELDDRQGAIADFQQSAKLCLDSGRIGCYQDAQFQLEQLR